MNTFDTGVKYKSTKESNKINLKEIEMLLKDMKKYEAKISDIELEIAELKDLQSIALKGINYNNLIKTNSLFSKTELQVMENLEIDQSIEVLNYKKRHMERFLSRIRNAINSLDELEKQIIEMKCLENKIWRFVTFEANLEERQCREIKNRALKKIGKLLINVNMFNIY